MKMVDSLVTIVTLFWNPSAKIRTRYLNSVSKFVTINCPMVIFGKDAAQGVISARPKEYKTEIEELGEDKNSQNVRGVTEDGNITIKSKLDMLDTVAKKNPFGSKYFIWIDSNLFSDEISFDTSVPWPDKYKIDFKEGRVLLKKRPRGSATIFAVDQQALKNIRDHVSKSGSQYNFDSLLERSPGTFAFWKNRQVEDSAFIEAFATGTYIPGGYTEKEPDVKLLCVATKEVKREDYKVWEETAKYFGYDYEILGRNESWGGWARRLKFYKDKILEINHPYIVLTDATDAFISGPPREIKEKFLAMNKNAVVGAEMRIHYAKGDHHKKEIANFFDGRKESEQRFPNGGFVMGKRENVLELLEINRDCRDDQASYFDTIYENKMDLSIDYHTELAGNVPNYQSGNVESIGYFSFDEKSKRYKNIHNGNAPCVFHFPGRNWNPMGNFCHRMFPNVPAMEGVIQMMQQKERDELVKFGWVALLAFFIAAFIILVMIHYAQPR